MKHLKMRRFSTLVCAILFLCASLAHAADWMLDPNLQRVAREKLEFPDAIPMLPADIATFSYLLIIEHDIRSLKGLEHAIDLEFLHLQGVFRVCSR